MPQTTPSPVVLVTGAAKRLGREIALALAKGGWQVAVHYRASEQDAIKTVADCARAGCRSASFQADLDDETAVRALLPRVVAHFGQIDAVVNSASTFEQDAADTFSFAALEKHIRSNTAAPILLAQALHTHVKTRNATGAVINLLDQKLWNQNPDFLSYTLSKAALEAANTMLAMALAPEIRVVGIAPGLTLTSYLISDEKFEALHKMAPLGRSSTPECITDAVQFALKNASITGTTLIVDGGQHLIKNSRDFSLL
jgi:NAD(P)-dependent dehydrogenase (short-subunit alcohol dehydrogenase family)